jgi:hypothetical protein
LVAVPGEGDLPGRDARLQTCLELGDLFVGEVFSAAAEQTADLVQRVVLVPAPTQGVLLDAAAGLVDDLGAELDDVERVQDRDRVRQLVPKRVGVTAERVEGGFGDAGGEFAALGLEPGGVGGAGPAGHHVEQAGVQVAVLVAGQVDHSGDRPVGVPDPARSPDVLVDPEDGDVL